ncbi:unnamed protein product [Allacma fusca]|uniref:Uncharacterized protein n=1 Tax=Allacma fusca TaxID=39272 RepID=A0A8J2KBK8_9HEXA|nr:unnamed protein product [Allacma fusca]
MDSPSLSNLTLLQAHNEEETGDKLTCIASSINEVPTEREIIKIAKSLPKLVSIRDIVHLSISASDLNQPNYIANIPASTGPENSVKQSEALRTRLRTRKKRADPTSSVCNNKKELRMRGKQIPDSIVSSKQDDPPKQARACGLKCNIHNSSKSQV